jgi:hypothetical protein
LANVMLDKLRDKAIRHPHWTLTLAVSLHCRKIRSNLRHPTATKS